MPVYPVYSLRVGCARPLPGVRALPGEVGDRCDVEIALGGTSPIPEQWLVLPWRMVREQIGPGWVLRLHTAQAEDGVALRLYTHDGQADTTVLYAPRAARIAVYWVNPHLDEDAFWADLAGWILGTVLGYAVCMRGLLNLHGSVVSVNGQAVALLGGSGAGKSTLAAAFVKAGHAMVSDDHVVLSPEGARFCVLPGPPWLRLWPESLPLLDLDADPLPRVVGAYAKRYVNVSPSVAGTRSEWGWRDGASQGRAAPMPLAAIYVLTPRDDARAGVSIESLSPTAALLQMLRKRFLTVSLSAEHTAAQLRALSALAAQVPVRLLQRPEGLDTLPDVVRAIQEDLALTGG